MADLALSTELLWGIAFFWFGAIFGSFANVIIYRMPEGKSIVFPGSHCQSCSKPVKWFDNIPLLSYLLLRGKCRHCGTGFSSRYMVVEFLMAIAFCALYFHNGFSIFLVEHMVFAFGLIVVSFIDLDHMIIPDEFSYSGMAFGLLGAAINADRSFLSSLSGLFLGGGFLWAIAWIYLVLRKQDGMGGGDIKLMAWIGAVLGWQSIPFVIISSSVLGTFVGAFIMLRTKGGLQTAIPFGPYLALGAILYIFLGESFNSWYLTFFIPSMGPVN